MNGDMVLEVGRCIPRAVLHSGLWKCSPCRLLPITHSSEFVPDVNLPVGVSRQLLLGFLHASSHCKEGKESETV